MLILIYVPVQSSSVAIRVFERDVCTMMILLCFRRFLIYYLITQGLRMSKSFRVRPVLLTILTDTTNSTNAI